MIILNIDRNTCRMVRKRKIDSCNENMLKSNSVRKRKINSCDENMCKTNSVRKQKINSHDKNMFKTNSVRKRKIDSCDENMCKTYIFAYSINYLKIIHLLNTNIYKFILRSRNNLYEAYICCDNLCLDVKNNDIKIDLSSLMNDYLTGGRYGIVVNRCERYATIGFKDDGEIFLHIVLPKIIFPRYTIHVMNFCEKKVLVGAYNIFCNNDDCYNEKIERVSFLAGRMTNNFVEYYEMYDYCDNYGNYYTLYNHLEKTITIIPTSISYPELFDK